MAKVDHRETVLKLAEAVGRPRTRQLLVAAGVSVSAADKLSRGKYPYEIGLLLGAAIERAVQAAKVDVA